MPPSPVKIYVFLELAVSVYVEIKGMVGPLGITNTDTNMGTT